MPDSPSESLDPTPGAAAEPEAPAEASVAPAAEREELPVRSAPKAKGPVLAWVVILQGKEAGSAIQLQEHETILGRDPKRVNIHIDDATVSSLHAKVVRRPAEEGEAMLYTLYDLGSSNGTWSGEEEIFERPLHDGDRFRLGRTELAFKCL